MGDKTMIVGVLDLGTEEDEPQAVIEERIHAALQHVPANRLVIAPDCGMKYLSRSAAFDKLVAMTGAARVVRATL
ncbi:MAG: hypothetical protein NVSMB2_23060 [Chloroflexota bacterium]